MKQIGLARIAFFSPFTSFLTERIGHQEAIALLRGPDYSISNIARHLDYSNAANVTHAFRRWAGTKPSSFWCQSLGAA